MVLSVTVAYVTHLDVLGICRSLSEYVGLCSAVILQIGKEGVLLETKGS